MKTNALEKTTNALKLLFIFSTVIFFISACANFDTTSDTPEGLFKIAQEFEKADRAQVAIQKYNEVKNRFPYSSLATTAELAVADLYYKTESFAEAQVSYQNFRDLHPKHPKIDYVVFQIGMSFFEQLPETSDRDLTLANDAIYHFNEVIKSYPNSEYVGQAKVKREKAFEMLADKELYIADFYFKSKKYESALSRYESSLKKYPDVSSEPRALLGAAKSADKLNDTAKKDKYITELKNRFANSQEAKEVQ